MFMARKLLAACFLLAHLASGASAWFWPFKTQPSLEFEHDHVKKLTATDFEDYVLKEDKRFYFAKFYAPWCGHCKSLAPVWGRLAEENTDSRVEFVQVDCTANRKLCDKASVRGFPDIKVFYNGRIGLAMRGGKDLEGMRKFVREALPTVRENHAKALAHEAEEASKGAAAPPDSKELR